jgi:DNA repair exonuclease SbcCD ATPase subunit
MSKSNDFYEGENVKELNISQENQKFYEKLMQDLGFSSEKVEKSKSKAIDLEKAYQTINKFQENNTNQKDSLQQQKSSKNLISRINELQNELNLVSKEINDYVELYSENTLFKKESNFNKISEELKLYSSKLNNILNSDLYKNTLIPKKILSSDKNGLKEQIKTNLANYTNSTARLMELISQEKENFMYQKNVDTTTHQMFMNKFFYENNDISNNFEKNILEIEKELTNIENIIGIKKLDMDENLNITQMLNKLLKTVSEKKFSLFKEKTLTELNEILDEVIKEQEISSEISQYFVKLKELYAIYEVYENYDEIMKYIKKRLMAIMDMHEKSINFNNDLDFLKKIIEENEKQFGILGKKYSETFEEIAGLENILKELKNIDKYFGQLLVQFIEI